jgi:hypothetical protein
MSTVPVHMTVSAAPQWRRAAPNAERMCQAMTRSTAFQWNGPQGGLMMSGRRKRSHVGRRTYRHDAHRHAAHDEHWDEHWDEH